MCPTSNVHTGAVASLADHPIDLLRRLRFRVTLNTDNRLMSGVSLSSEFLALAAFINKPFTRDRLLATLHEVRQSPAPIIGTGVPPAPEEPAAATSD